MEKCQPAEHWKDNVEQDLRLFGDCVLTRVICVLVDLVLEASGRLLCQTLNLPRERNERLEVTGHGILHCYSLELPEFIRKVQNTRII